MNSSHISRIMFNIHNCGQSLTAKWNGRLLAVLVILLLGFFGPIPVSVLQAQDGGTVHIVAQGEYLSTIARKYNVSVAAIQQHNNIRNANLINPGDVLRIPSVARPLSTPTSIPNRNTAQDSTIRPSSTPTKSPASRSTIQRATPTPTTGYALGGITGHSQWGEPVYIVRRADTLSSIGSRFGVSYWSIIDRNNLRSNTITVSQRLIIPTKGTIYKQESVSPTSRPTPSRRSTPSTSTNGGASVSR
jgi:LysM repeat protein